VRNPVFGKGTVLAAALLLASGGAQASFLHGETLDKVADWLAIIVLIIVPVIGIVVFWLVHILPEVIAEKRHHPQKEAITTLCLLSLVFGGLLWPIAWLWAYTRPIGYRMAYGTDKHEDYFEEMAAKARAGGLLREELRHLREELDEMESRGALPPALKGLRAELDGLRARVQAAEAPAAAPARPEEKK
jgi:CBS domain containing-hemolysin-like protein